MQLVLNRRLTALAVGAAGLAVAAALVLAPQATSQNAVSQERTDAFAQIKRDIPIIGDAERRARASSDGEAPPVTAPSNGTVVTITPSDNANAIVQSHPAGTTFEFTPGVHRLASITARNGDVYRGQLGAELNGARLLEPAAFTRTGNYWSIGGQTQDILDETTPVMVPGLEIDAQAEELFARDVPLKRVSTKAQLDRPTEWYFDETADRIWLATDPASLAPLEASAVAHAIDGPSTASVTVDNLIITKYASPTQQGAVNASRSRSWTVTNNTISLNHSWGLKTGAGMTIRGNRFIANGQLGLGGTDGGAGYTEPITMTDNEVALNHRLGYDWEWEGGGFKMVKTTDMIFRNNWVHSNGGAGAWWDIDNRNATIESNLVENNAFHGVFYEISYGALIRFNTIRNNDVEADAGRGAGIFISNSNDVEIANNALYDNNHEILIANTDRGSGRQGIWHVRNLFWHDNQIEITKGRIGLRSTIGDDYYTDQFNRATDNTYFIDAGCTCFEWNGAKNWSQWQGAGLDPASNLQPRGADPQVVLTDGATAFRKVTYGPR